jgi:GR25 family glycosyltransferase involved in LPS biosynthesis
MAMLPWRRILVLCLLVFGLLMTAGLSNGPRIREHLEDAWQGAVACPTECDRTSSPTKVDSTLSTTEYDRTLSIAAKVFVANLPRRGDRRRNMTTLEHTVGAHFTFVDAVDMRSAAIRNIMNHVRAQREGPAVPFAWPSTRSEVPLDWTGHLPSGVHVSKNALTCNQGDATPIPAESAQGWDWLSEGRISCWETHLRIIRQIADMRGSGYWSTGRALPISPADVAIILEDDVDMELNIRERLLGLWPSLPKEWDMIFFGESHTSFLDMNLPAHALPQAGAGRPKARMQRLAPLLLQERTRRTLCGRRMRRSARTRMPCRSRARASCSRTWNTRRSRTAVRLIKPTSTSS